MRVSQAVTASSAVPGIFAPLLIANHAGSCGYPQPEWIEDALAHPEKSRRKHHAAQFAVTYLDGRKRPYVFLVDGGVADNIGARRIIADVVRAGRVFESTGKTDVPVPEHMLYIVVNAQAGGRHDWEQAVAAIAALGAGLDLGYGNLPLQLRDHRASSSQRQRMGEAGGEAWRPSEDLRRRGCVRQPFGHQRAKFLQRRSDDLGSRRRNRGSSDRGRGPTPARFPGLQAVHGVDELGTEHPMAPPLAASFLSNLP